MNYLLTNQETERLSFRKVTRNDFHAWLPFFDDKSVLKYFGIDASLPKRELCENWFKKVFHRYDNHLGGMNAIILKASGELIGMCGLLIQTVEGVDRLEVGYSLLPKYRGKGYGTEAAIKCKNFAFENNLAKELISMIHIDNKASVNVAVKNGMQLERLLDYKGMPAKIYSLKKKKPSTSSG